MIDYQKVEKELIEEGLLHFPSVHDKQKSLTEFLLNVVNKYAQDYSTYYVATSKIQHHSGYLRSTGDLFRLSRHYFPTITLKEVIVCLYKLDIDDLVHSTYCQDIKKRVWEYLRDQPYNSVGYDYIDELGCNWADYKKLYDESIGK